MSEKSTGSLWGDIKRSVKDEIPKFVLLKDNQKICAECAEKVRLLYPVQYSRKYAGDGEYEDVYNDTLNTITLAEYKQALADVKTKRKELEEQYGSCEAVLSVSSTHENKRNGKTEYQIRGRILYGKASKGDMIQVAQNGSSNLMRIKWLQQPNGEAADSVGEGYYAIVTVAENTSCIHPGDTLIACRARGFNCEVR